MTGAGYLLPSDSADKDKIRQLFVKLFSGVASFRICIRQAYLLHQFNGVRDNVCFESELEAQQHSEIN